MEEAAMLNIENLRVDFPTSKGVVHAVRGLNLSIRRGERVGIVGESGSGKSMTGRSILRLVKSPGIVTADTLTFDGRDIQKMPEKEMRKIRGSRIAMVMQDPKYSLNPVMTVGKQLMEALYTAKPELKKKQLKELSLEALHAVKINNPERVFQSWPHELSGGMGQRVMIAMMTVLGPDLLIADEPTSALDVTVQMQVLAIMDQLVEERNMGLMFISHDLELVSTFCDRIIVMYAGLVMEEILAKDLRSARHDYTKGLLASLPHIDQEPGDLPVLNRNPQWLEARS